MDKWQQYMKHFNERGITRARAMYALYQAGMTLQQIADEYGVTRQAVFDVFKRYGMNKHVPMGN